MDSNVCDQTFLDAQSYMSIDDIIIKEGEKSFIEDQKYCDNNEFFILLNNKNVNSSIDVEQTQTNNENISSDIIYEHLDEIIIDEFTSFTPYKTEIYYKSSELPDKDILKTIETEEETDNVVEELIQHSDSVNDLNFKGKTKNKRKKYVCTENNCNKSYASYSYFKIHLKSHNGEKTKPFACNDCEKSFDRPFGLKNHIRVHTNERPFICTFTPCCKGFKTSGDLLKHKRTHTNERPYNCLMPDCNMSFTTKNIRKMHMNFHLNIRQFKCNFIGCNKKFINITNLQNHQRIHTNDKPFKCKLCNKSFTEYSSLFKHEKIHNIKETQKDDITVFQCDLCNNLEYKREYQFTNHLKNKHSIIINEITDINIDTESEQGNK